MKKRTVLFVDDDKNMLRSIERALISEPYTCLFADNAEEALDMLELNEVHVVVSDLHMPDMSGLALLNVVKINHPSIIRLIFSGDICSDNVLEAVNQGQVFRYIPKPCNLMELKTIVRQAIDYYHLYSERSMLISYIEKLLEGTDPDKVNLKLIKTLISDTNSHLYEWCEESNSKEKSHCSSSQN
jgi:DNA-binding NtrC family response regulator